MFSGNAIVKILALISDLYFTLKPIVVKAWKKFEEKSRLDKAKAKVKNVVEENKTLKNAKDKAKHMASYFKRRS